MSATTRIDLFDAPRIAVNYRALCPTCSWEGPIRGSSLTALDDYDAHIRDDAHVNVLLDHEIGSCDTCGAAYPLASRDGRCGDCGECADHCPHVNAPFLEAPYA